MDNLHLTKIKQHFRNNSLAVPEDEIRLELSKVKSLIFPGASIAIAIGSRGIKNILLIVREVAEFLKDNKAIPFIIPAMGSHGGATAEGQAEILASYGISEDSIGIPVRSSMDVVELPAGDSPVPVYMDKYGFESDGIILINRVKPHTDFHAEYESGLVKMTVIGLGKEKQASAIHHYGVYGLSTLIPLAAKQVLSTGKIIGGIALVENAYDETMIIKVLKSDQFLDLEPELLELARNNMASLPVNDIDVLIIDQMGKDISGVGIDPNIIGRTKITGQKEPVNPDIRAIVVNDLTAASHGNAIGIGLSDVITKKLYDKIDFSTTYNNVVTSSFLERGKIPVVANTMKEAYEIALRSCGHIKQGEVRIIRIIDTLHLNEIYVSQSILNEIFDSKKIEIIKENAELFNEENDIAIF